MSTNSTSDLPNPLPLNEAQRKLIKSTVPILEEQGTEITRRMYKAMLTANPFLNNTFNNSKQQARTISCITSADYLTYPACYQRGDQAEALARSVYAYAANIDDLTPILPVVERIAHKHASLHIQPEHYKIVGKYLLEAITDVVGPDVFKGELFDAWYAAYWQLANIFIGREADLYSDAAWVGWKDFVVRSKVKETEDITSFYLVPRDGTPLPSYKPGQYISIQHFIERLGFKQSRQYSLSDSPNSRHFRISVRKAQGPNPGTISNHLHDTLHEGDTLQVAFPFGEFYLADSKSPVVLISAGVGLTPLTSMLHSILENPTPRQVSWIQGVHSRSAHALNGEVLGLLKPHPAALVKKAIFYSDVHDAVLGDHYDFLGRVDLSKIDDATLRLADSTVQYYVCGPEGFMEEVGKGLKGRGVDVRRIHAEVFSGAPNPFE